MTVRGIVIAGVIAALAVAAGGTALTLAAGIGSHPLDWASTSFQQYGSGARLPSTGDGAAGGGSSAARGWMILGGALVAAIVIFVGSFSLLSRNDE